MPPAGSSLLPAPASGTTGLDMKIYVHYDAEEPAHTEVMKFDGDADVTFELARLFYVDAYKSKHGVALDPSSLVATNRLCSLTHEMDASVFEELNEGDDLFFAPADGAARGAAAVPACAGSSVEDSISQIKLRIKKATDDGDYDQLAPLAEQIQQLQARASEVSQASVVDGARAAPPPINPVQASKQAAGGHSHYYWDRQPTTRLPEPNPVRMPTRARRGTEIEKVKTITKYSMDDAGAWVKLYISFQGAGSLPEGAVKCEFRERSFDLTIEVAEVGAEDGSSGVTYVHRMHVPVLAECTDPPACRLRVKPSQVVVSLRKLSASSHWQELHKIRCIGETGTIAPDYGETTVVTV